MLAKYNRNLKNFEENGHLKLDQMGSLVEEKSEKYTNCLGKMKQKTILTCNDDNTDPRVSLNV